MTATDTLGRPLRDLRISVTDRCNFRCVYCMPREVFGRDYEFLERAELLTFEEIERLARIFVADHRVSKIRLTGGEPLVRREVERLVAMLARIPLQVRGEHAGRPQRRTWRDTTRGAKLGQGRTGGPPERRHSLPNRLCCARPNGEA